MAAQRALAFRRMGGEMTDLGSVVVIFCNTCHGNTDHAVKGTYTHPSGSPALEPLPSDEERAIRRSVDTFINDRLERPDIDAGWEWLLNSDAGSPDEDVDGAIQDLEHWLERSASLEQALWHPEMTTCRLLRQEWRWIDIVRACQRGLERQERWEILKCNGCRTPSLRLLGRSEEDDVHHPETGLLLKRKEHPKFYPPRENDDLPSWKSPSWVYQTPEAVRRLLNESYMALNAGLLAVGAMGIRSVVEFAMVEFVGEKGGFEHKLHRLLDQGMITEIERSALSDVIDFGHAAVHRQQNPTAQDVQTLIDLVEMFLWNLFVMPHQASELRRNTRQRS